MDERSTRLAEIQREVGEWSRRNFPAQDPYDPFEGICEEIGELAHARLKMHQGIRGTQEEHEAEERDAIGDAAIYLLDFAGRNGLELEIGDELAPRDDRESFRGIISQIGRLANTLDFPSCLAEEASTMLTRLHDYAGVARGWDFLTILETTWASVRQRDWQAHPQNGVKEK